MVAAPTLLFFRRRPSSWGSGDRLASSLQSLESSFFLLALGRFPHALTVCASSIESCLQAATEVGNGGTQGLKELERRARDASPAVSSFPSLEEFRALRNKITHRGFSPRDDSTAASLYIEFGLPFLSVCLKEFHGFDLADGLLQEYAEHLRVARETFERGKSLTIEKSYCFHSFSHLLRTNLKEEFSASWELESLVDSRHAGSQYERTTDERDKIEALFEVPARFDCPVCLAADAAVAEIDVDSFDKPTVMASRLACVQCGFVIGNGMPHLTDVLLEEALQRDSEKIRRACGD
jgi:hypothetical protein